MAVRILKRNERVSVQQQIEREGGKEGLLQTVGKCVSPKHLKNNKITPSSVCMSMNTYRGEQAWLQEKSLFKPIYFFYKKEKTINK